MKNFICTSEGFVKSAGFSEAKQDFVIVYTEKVRDAQKFNTQAASKFMERHNIKGFVWKPYEQEAIRNMYEVKKLRMAWKEEKDKVIEEWQPVKAFMASESDINFLTSKKLNSEDMMTFDEAKAEALRLNLEMMDELKHKISELADARDPSKDIESSPTFGRNRPN